MRRYAPLLLVFVLLTAGGCSASNETETPEIADAFIDRIRELRELPGISDLLIEILEDYWITDAEFHQAKQAFSNCVTVKFPDIYIEFDDWGRSVRGLDALVDENVTLEDALRMVEVVTEECELRYLAWMPSLFHEMRNNPNALSDAGWLHECLRAKGAPEGSALTVDAVDELLMNEWLPAQEFSSSEVEACFFARFPMLAPPGS